MARIEDFAGSASSTGGRRKAAKPPRTKKQGKEREVSADVVQPAALEQGVAPPAVPEPATTRGPAAILEQSAVVAQSTGEGLVTVEQEREAEEEEAVRELPLKRRKIVRVIERPPCPSGKGKGKEKEEEEGKRKKWVTGDGEWVSTIRLDEAASIVDPGVALYIAEKAIPPTAEKLTDALESEELSARLIRNCVRDLVYAVVVRKRVEQQGSLEREATDLREQVRALRTELSDVKEERDVSRAKFVSLEEEKKLWEEDRDMLKG